MFIFLKIEQIKDSYVGGLWPTRLEPTVLQLQLASGINGPVIWLNMAATATLDSKRIIWRSNKPANLITASCCSSFYSYKQRMALFWLPLLSATTIITTSTITQVSCYMSTQRQMFSSLVHKQRCESELFQHNKVSDLLYPLLFILGSFSFCFNSNNLNSSFKKG